MINYQKIFQEIHEELQGVEREGHVADYIPELAQIDPDHFGVYLTMVDGSEYGLAEGQKRFSIQSIAKVFSFVLAYSRVKSDIWARMDVEPAGTSFNSLVQLEYDKGIPRNPFINAGGIVVCDILISELKDAKSAVLNFVKEISGVTDITFNTKVAQSEKMTGFRNYALVNLMKSFGNIKNEIDQVMDLYFSICSLEMSCQELTKAFLFLANNGVIPYSGKRILSPSRTKRTNAVMQTCGFYDEAGQFTFKVGLPGKSGVGGGIVAIHPEKYAIAVWSPRLNKKGNSHLGMLFLEAFTTKTKSSIF
ncbi:MAG: glutaminase [Chitinophagales bacterium]|nr:glutaminase [Chitinophagales bacterium]